MPDSGGKFVSEVVFPAAVRPSIATRSRLEDRRDTLSAISLTNRLRAAEIDDGSGWRHVETDSKELTVPFSRFPESRVAGGNADEPQPGRRGRQLPGSGHAQGARPLSRGGTATPVSMSSFTISMRQQWFTHVRLLVAHLTR